VTWAQAQPRQERWRELGAERQSVRFADKQCRVSASHAIDLHEIARSEILDPGLPWDFNALWRQKFALCLVLCLPIYIASLFATGTWSTDLPSIAVGIAWGLFLFLAPGQKFVNQGPLHAHEKQSPKHRRKHKMTLQAEWSTNML
jgi:hypothetical protein